jgi:hypothetical protein
MFGLVRENGMWRIGYNGELCREYKALHLVSCIKFKRQQWPGHVQRLSVDLIPNKALKAEWETQV